MEFGIPFSLRFLGLERPTSFDGFWIRSRTEDSRSSYRMLEGKTVRFGRPPNTPGRGVGKGKAWPLLLLQNSFQRPKLSVDRPCLQLRYVQAQYARDQRIHIHVLKWLQQNPVPDVWTGGHE